ncbi:hypothetical protein BJ165DRAFT_1439491 [Panaeolus papilionaceus]|nr:hypothetical protein BJ165DRAFT_1439491 [Panaeolus papilionaceus]
MLIEPSSSRLASNKDRLTRGQTITDRPPEYSENGHGIARSGPLLPPREPPKMDHANHDMPSPFDDTKSPTFPRPHVPYPEPQKVASHPSPTATTDQVHIFERDGNIQGTFYIDPSVRALDQSHRKGSKCKPKEHPPHASFRSRKGTINLELGTTGNILQTPKGNVSISSRSGNIKVNLLSMHPTRPRISLETESRSGTIVIFLPHNFVGVVHLNNKKGQLHVLPALQSISRMVKNSDHEAIFMIGGHDDASDLSREASFCQATTRTGSIIVGLSGRDHYSPEVGFWKKLGSLFRGSQST